MTGFPLVARQRRFSSRILALAATAEIGGSAVVLLLWPRAWPLGALLISFAAIRVSVLAERSRDAAAGLWAGAFNALRLTALVLAALGMAAIVAGALRLVIGSSQGM